MTLRTVHGEDDRGDALDHRLVHGQVDVGGEKFDYFLWKIIVIVQYRPTLSISSQYNLYGRQWPKTKPDLEFAKCEIRNCEQADTVVCLRRTKGEHRENVQ